MARKASRKKIGAKARVGVFRFKIEAYTPDTMPMARLAEYLRELATILGEPKDVHLVGIEPGSTVPVLHVEYESIPKVQVRADAVRRGDAPRDPLVAYRRVNEMLREDNGRALVQRGSRGPKLLEFPGRDEVQEMFTNVKQFGTIDAHVNRVGGSGDSIPVLLESEGKQIAGCHTTRQIAKELGKHLFEPVRVVGTGVWERDAEGAWNLRTFKIETFEPLEDLPLSAAVEQLRAINVNWDAAAYDELSDLRRGRGGNGGT